MNSRDLWIPLSSGSPDARVVVRTASGEEVDVSSVRCYAQLCVIETDEPLLVFADSPAPADGVITPEQLSDLIDAHPAGIEECTAMLSELQYQNIHNLAELAAVLRKALDDDDDDPSDT